MINSELLRELLLDMARGVPENARVYVEFGSEHYPVVSVGSCPSDDFFGFSDSVVDAGWRGIPEPIPITLAELVHYIAMEDGRGAVMLFQGSERSYAYYDIHKRPFRYEAEPATYYYGNVLIIHAGRFVSGGENGD